MKLAIAGASGRMGRMLIEAALAEPDTTVAAALDRADSPDIGRDCGEFLGRTTGARVTADLRAVAGCDVLIDFTRPEATLSHLDACVAAGTAIVIGTTGFDDAGKAAKFKDFANKRTTRALRSLRAVGKLANRRAYVYTPEQVAKIGSALNAELARVAEAFKGGTKSADTFEL